MDERTPAEVIAAIAHEVDRGRKHTGYSADGVAQRIVMALDAAGLSVTPKVDDDTRREVEELVRRRAMNYGPSNQESERIAELLAAAYLGGETE